MLRILLAGDPTITAEFASACRDHGAAVAFAGTKQPPSTGKGKAARFDLAVELTLAGTSAKAQTLAMLDRSLPGTVPLFSNSLAATVAEQISWVKHPGRLAGIGAYPSLLEGGLLEFTSPLSPALRKAAEGFAVLLGKQAAFVPDLPGMILPRIRCMLTNEACFALTERLAPSSDIDTAMRLGTNYPSGPLEWGDRMGPANVLAILEALRSFYGEERYRPSPLLRRAALVGSIASAATELSDTPAGEKQR